MPKANDKMKCPGCGREMNHHANKLVEPRNAEESRHADPELGLMMVEFHACAECGTGDSRLAARGA